MSILTLLTRARRGRPTERRAELSGPPPVVITHRADLTGRSTMTVERIPAHAGLAAQFGARASQAGLLALVHRRRGRFLALCGTERAYPGEDLGLVAAARARELGATYIPGGPAVHRGPEPRTYVATPGPLYETYTDPATLRTHATLAVGTLRVRFDHPETARSWVRALICAALELETATDDSATEARLESEEAAQ